MARWLIDARNSDQIPCPFHPQIFYFDSPNISLFMLLISPLLLGTVGGCLGPQAASGTAYSLLITYLGSTVGSISTL
jgi:hypothetical protein